MESDEGPSFQSKVVRRAVVETLSAFDARLRTIIIAIALMFVGLGIRAWTGGLEALTHQAGETLLSAILPVLIVGFIIAMWNLWLAPSLVLHDEVKSGASITYGIGVTPSKTVNWNIWKRREKFTVAELSRILVKSDPVMNHISSEGIALQSLLFEVMKSKKLKFFEKYSDPDRRIEFPIDYNTEIPRADAIAWAKENGFHTSHFE